MLRDWGGRLPAALLFPGHLRSALATVGWQTVYRHLAEVSSLAVEPFHIEENGFRARSFFSGRRIAEFPLIAVSLNFELDAVNLVGMLETEGIGALSEERGDYPLVLAGGPLAFLNPVPLFPTVDLFWAGEFDPSFSELMEVFRLGYLRGAGRRELLEEAVGRPGVLVPGVKSSAPVEVVRCVEEGNSGILADPAYSMFVSGESEFRDSLLIEVNRGCPYGCRFCAAGFIYRPSRQAESRTILDIIDRGKPRKVGLIGTALTDRPDLPGLLEEIHSRGIKYSLSSVRADGLTDDLAGFMRRTGTRTVTLALEGMSSSIRQAANKNLKPEDFFRAVETVSRHRYNHLKVYLIIGWPGRDDRARGLDTGEFGEFLRELERARLCGQAGKSSGVELVTLSLSYFVPKPWTPLQWAGMPQFSELKSEAETVAGMCRGYSGLKVAYDNPQASMAQALIGRGDEKVNDFLRLAVDNGGSLKKAMKAWDADIASYIHRTRDDEENFPWEVIRHKVSRAYLFREWKKYSQLASTPPCPPRGCTMCPGCS